MSENEKQVVAKEKTQATATEKNKPANAAPPLNKQVKRSSNAGVYVILILLATGCAGGFYYLWEDQQQSEIRNRLVVQSLNEAIDNLKQSQALIEQKTQQEIQSINKANENLRQNLTKLIRDNDHLRNDWLMAEAEYLIQLANHRILLEKDVTTAVIALEAADARLAEIADPALISIRKILADDLLKLRNVPIFDMTGLSITLSALNKNIANIPLRTPDPRSHKITEAEKKDNSGNVSSIKELPAAVWRDLKNLIVIRDHEKPIEPLLAPNQNFFLQQNLGLLLEQARLALLSSQNEIYQERLATVIKWVNEYYDTEHNVTRNMLASLEELKKYDINPPLPDISLTYSAIKKYRLKKQLPDNVKETTTKPVSNSESRSEVKPEAKSGSKQ